MGTLYNEFIALFWVIIVPSYEGHSGPSVDSTTNDSNRCIKKCNIITSRNCTLIKLLIIIFSDYNNWWSIDGWLNNNRFTAKSLYYWSKLFSLDASPLVNNSRLSKVYHPRRRPIHLRSCMFALWIHSNYLSPAIKLDSRERARRILRAIDEALKSAGLPNVLRESKHSWEGLARRASNFAR